MNFSALVYNHARSFSSQAAAENAENTTETDYHSIIKDTEKATGDPHLLCLAENNLF